MGAYSSKAHGICMVVGWVGCSSTGQFIAKHYRGAFPKRQIAGKDFWFAAHWLNMFLTVLLTIVAFIIIYVMNSGVQKSNTHSVLGLIVGILCFMQPVMGTLRPGPQVPNRFWFNWGHWLVGNLAHILAITNLYLAGNFRTVKEKQGYFWLMTAYVLIHWLTDHFLVKIPKETRFGQVQSDENNVEMNGTSKTSEDPEVPKIIRKLVKAVPKIKKWVFFGYIITVALITFILCLIVGNVGQFGATTQPNNTSSSGNSTATTG